MALRAWSPESHSWVLCLAWSLTIADHEHSHSSVSPCPGGLNTFLPHVVCVCYSVTAESGWLSSQEP